MSPERGVDIKVRMQNARAASRDADRVGKSVTGIGKAAEKGRKSFRLFNRGVERSNSLFRRGAKLAGTWIAGVAAFEGLKGAVDTTVEFTHATVRLHQAMGLSVPVASQLAAALTTRNIPIPTLTTAWNKNAKAIDAARGKWEKAGVPFRQLGIDHQTLLQHGDDTNFMLRLEADRLAGVTDSTKRASIAQAIWGRGWTKLLPILGHGSKGLDDLAKMADKYGITLDDKTIKSQEDLVAAQREAKFASLGLQLAIGRTLTPAVIWLQRQFTTLVDKLRNGQGPWKTLRDDVKSVADAFKRGLKEDDITKAFSNAGNRITELFGQYAPKALNAFWSSFIGLSPGGKALTIAFLSTKLGLTRALFEGMGKSRGKSFGRFFLAGAALSLTAGISAKKGGGITIDKGMLRLALVNIMLFFAARGQWQIAAPLAIGLGISYLTDLLHNKAPGPKKIIAAAQAPGNTERIIPKGASHNPKVTGPALPSTPANEYIPTWGWRGPVPGQRHGGPADGGSVIHTTVNIDGKAVAHAVHRAGKNKQSTR